MNRWVVTTDVFIHFFFHIYRKQITRIRIKYFSSMVRQEVGWFDCSASDSNVAVRISEYNFLFLHFIGKIVNENLNLFKIIQRYRKNTWRHCWKSESLLMSNDWFCDMCRTIFLLRLETNTSRHWLCTNSSYIQYDCSKGTYKSHTVQGSFT